MRVRVQVLAQAAYAVIEWVDGCMDVRLEPGRSPAKSLEESAQALEDQAWRMMERAGRMREAALVLRDRGAAPIPAARAEEYAAGFDAVLEEVE